MGLNYIVLFGEVISSPEKKHTLDGLIVATFNISFNTNSDDNIINKHSIKVSVVNKLVDKVVKEVGLNDKVLVEGRLLTKIVEEKGFKHKIPYIQLSNFCIVEKNSFEIENENKEEKLNINDEEIPF